MDRHIEPKETTVQFNLGAQQLMIIGSLLSNASTYYQKAEYGKLFVCLKSLKLQVISRLNLTEREGLEQQEARIGMFFSKLKQESLNPNEDSNERINILIKNKYLIPALESYDIALKEYLEKKGFLVPLKEDRTSVFGQKDPDEE